MNMDIDERIYQALLNMHADDLTVIRQYVRWVKFRRRMHNFFYAPAHWVNRRAVLSLGEGRTQVHWVGNYWM